MDDNEIMEIISRKLKRLHSTITRESLKNFSFSHYLKANRNLSGTLLLN